jgi:hypothetical protein
MIDPVFLAFGGTIGGGVLIKCVENFINKRKARRGTGSIAISGYDNRWKNPEYVHMIHETRDLEREELGESVTECLCEGHIAPKGNGCGFLGCGHVDCERTCVPDPVIDRGPSGVYKMPLLSAGRITAERIYASDHNQPKNQIIFTQSGMKYVSREELGQLQRQAALERRMQSQLGRPGPRRRPTTGDLGPN